MNGCGYRCNCARCRSRGLMAPAILITLGVMLLLSEFGTVRGQNVIPVLLIVIGLVKVYQTTTSTEGHQIYGQVPPTPPSDPGAGQVHHG